MIELQPLGGGKVGRGQGGMSCALDKRSFVHIFILGVPPFCLSAPLAHQGPCLFSLLLCGGSDDGGRRSSWPAQSERPNSSDVLPSQEPNEAGISTQSAKIPGRHCLSWLWRRADTPELGDPDIQAASLRLARSSSPGGHQHHRTEQQGRGAGHVLAGDVPGSALSSGEGRA